MTTDTLHRYEKWPIGALVAAAGLNTAMWYAGATLPGEVRWLLPWLTVVAAVASVVAIDGSLLATIAGMREGRRSYWSVANIVITALFTALAGLTAHGQVAWLAPWLLGLFALTIVTYGMHLSQPSVNTHVNSLQAELAETRHQLTQVNISVNPTDTVVVDKRQQVRQLVDGGVSIAAAARQVGVSRQTASKYASVKE